MFRFTIRDLLWLTVVVALGVAWWVDRSRIARAAAKAAEWQEVAVWGEHRVLELERQAAVHKHSAPAPNLPSD